MPWESLVAVVNGMNYWPRPMPQSFCAYTPWLDRLNAQFLDSDEAPNCILYVCGPCNAIDKRPAAWDESLAKTPLMENYVLESEGEMRMPANVWPYGLSPRPAQVYLLRRSRHVRRLVQVASRKFDLSLGQALPLPATTNLLYLTLEAERSVRGNLTAAARSPEMLTATFDYADGTSADYRAVLSILRAGVLVNRRVESAEEIRNWLGGNVARNAAASSIRFTASSPDDFRSSMKGTLVEYAVVEK